MYKIMMLPLMLPPPHPTPFRSSDGYLFWTCIFGKVHSDSFPNFHLSSCLSPLPRAIIFIMQMTQIWGSLESHFTVCIQNSLYSFNQRTQGVSLNKKRHRKYSHFSSSSQPVIMQHVYTLHTLLQGLKQRAFQCPLKLIGVTWPIRMQ